MVASRFLIADNQLIMVVKIAQTRPRIFTRICKRMFVCLSVCRYLLCPTNGKGFVNRACRLVLLHHQNIMKTETNNEF